MRAWPFLNNYLKFTQSEQSLDFRGLIDAGWYTASGDQTALIRAKQLAGILEREVPSEEHAIAIGFSYMLDSAIIAIRSAEAAIEKSASKTVYALKQSYSLFDSIVLSNTQPGPGAVDESKIIDHNLLQGEIFRIYRDCNEISDPIASTEITATISRFKQRAVQEAEEVQTFLITNHWR